MPRLQGKRWCFTVNNPVPADYVSLNALGPTLTYLVFSDEIGDTGTPHIQGFFISKTNKTLVAAKVLIPRAHLELARGTNEQASDYCKGGGNTGKPPSLNIVEYGQLPNVPGKTNRYELFRDWVLAQPTKPCVSSVAREFPSIYLNSGRVQSFIDAIYPSPPHPEPLWRDYQQSLADILNGEPDARKIYFVVDPVGNSGKSWFAHHFHRSRPSDVQILSSGKRDDIAYAIDERKSVFLFDLPRLTSEHFQYSVLEQLKNGNVSSMKYESRMKTLSVPHVVVFMNEYPNLQYLSRDRPVTIVWNYEE